MPNEAELPKSLNVKEVAQALGIHINTAKRIIANGELPSFKVGRVVRVDNADLRQYIEEKKKERVR